jgi:Protein of unknown function (DUF4238)
LTTCHLSVTICYDPRIVTSITNRRDHYLPQSYLRGFIDPTRLSEQQPLWHFDVRNCIWSERSPREVGYRLGFYDYATSEIGSKPADNSFEEFERTFPLVRRELISTKFAHWKNQIGFLLRYVQMMRARSLLFFENKHAEGKGLRAWTIDEISPDRRTVKVRSMTPEPLSDDHIKNRAVAEMHAEIQNGAAWLCEFNWALRYCESPANPFITSELPFVCLGRHEKVEDAVKDSQSLLFFPLCWQACLIGSRQFFDIETDKFGDEDMLRVQKMYRNSAGLFLLSPKKLDYL